MLLAAHKGNGNTVKRLPKLVVRERFAMWILRGEDEGRAVMELKDMSDRAAAIVAGSMLETVLESFLRSVLIDTKKSGKGTIVLDDIFRSSGPLGSFSAKIDLTLMLGACTPEGWRDLDTIPEIRNAFAHQLAAHDFQVQRVKALCLNLKAFMDFVFPLGGKHEDPPPRPRKMFEEDLEIKLANPRERYLLAVKYYIVFLRGIVTAEPKPPLIQQPLC